jgi:hypothetical protein
VQGVEVGGKERLLSTLQWNLPQMNESKTGRCQHVIGWFWVLLQLNFQFMPEKKTKKKQTTCNQLDLESLGLCPSTFRALVLGHGSCLGSSRGFGSCAKLCVKYFDKVT